MERLALVACLISAAAPALASDIAHLPGDTITNQKGYNLQGNVVGNIMEIEKKLSPDCTKRRIVETKIIGEPFRINAGQVMKWDERWTIERCGKDVFYVIHFNFRRAQGTFNIEPPK